MFYGSLKEAFNAIDLDESGELSFAEFQKCHLDEKPRGYRLKAIENVSRIRLAIG